MRGDMHSIRELLRCADEPQHPESIPLQPATVRYRSGRVLALTANQAEDCLSISNPNGQVELSVRFTADGPVLSFADARLSLEKVRDLNVDCDHLKLRGRRGVELVSGDELVLRGQGDIHVDGENVLINCDDRSQYQR